MTAVPFELKLPDDKMKLLAEVALSRRADMGDVLQMIVVEWLEREAKLRRARKTLAQFSKGIGSSQPPHDTARQHDAYLYGKT